MVLFATEFTLTTVQHNTNDFALKNKKRKLSGVDTLIACSFIIHKYKQTKTFNVRKIRIMLFLMRAMILSPYRGVSVPDKRCCSHVLMPIPRRRWSVQKYAIAMTKLVVASVARMGSYHANSLPNMYG